MSAREEILARVRDGLRDVERKDPLSDVPVDWSYGKSLDLSDVIAEFIAKVRDHGAVVEHVAPTDLPESLVAALTALGSETVVLPPGLPSVWADSIVGAGFDVTKDDPPLTHGELDRVDTVITSCAAAMADPGTIALDHASGQGRRALTLLPDKHVCVVRTSQVVSDVPEAVAVLAPAVRARRPITWVSGGSATSDIELDRVEGVHGPRSLYVVLVDDHTE